MLASSGSRQPTVAPSRASSHRQMRYGPAPVVILAALVGSLAVVPCTAWSARNPQSMPAGTVAPPAGVGVHLADPETRRLIEAAPAWQGFVARHGTWTAVWNAATRSPHRAFGPPIRIAVRAERPEIVEAAVRAFIAGEHDLFGSPALEAASVRRVRNVWIASFRQIQHGVPVLGADWEFRVDLGGSLIAFGADAHRVPESTAAGPRLTGAAARAAACRGLSFDPTRDRVEGGETEALLPVETEDGLDYRTVLEAQVITADSPSRWLTYVDAATGEVLWRQNLVRYAVAGTVSGPIHALLPTDPVTLQPFRDLWVNVGTSAVATSATGAYSAPAAGTVTVSAQLAGRFCDVNRQDGIADASFSTTATSPATVDIQWFAAHQAERDAYYHVSRMHDYIKTLDPGLGGLEYPMPCAVNINATCNAFWDGNGVNFFAAGGGCPNTATMPDVIYHEYGHGVNDKVYTETGSTTGLTNAALHEGLADVVAAFVQDNPYAGKGFFGPGTILRSLDNTARWPENASPDPHLTGLIVGGAMWDLRESVGLTVATTLSHFAKYGRPDDVDDGVAMLEYFIEVLVADDDHGGINNGTPHFDQILAAFNAHGIGTALFMTLAHTPLADQTGPSPYPVAATALYNPPQPAKFGGLAGPPQLHYSVNGGGLQIVAMSPTDNQGHYAASIPGQSNAVVSYYVSVTDVYGVTITAPVGAPSSVYRFLAGTPSIVFTHDQEVDQGWTAGADGDDATSGLWTWTDPNGTTTNWPLETQPENDHTPTPGFLCWVTGNAIPGQPVGTEDVDGGKTTLTSALFDATLAGYTNPAISYWRWYTNDQGGSPGQDLWRTDISNDGGVSWVNVESTTRSNASWQRLLVRIGDYVTPSDQMLMRFVAEDTGDPSLVEAAVDDFQLLAFVTPVGVADGSAPRALALSIASATPAMGPVRLSYSLPAAGSASLRVFDLRGRAVRTLITGWQEAGVHGVAWDGRDDRGVILGSGAYFARLGAGGGVVTRTLVWMR